MTFTNIRDTDEFKTAVKQIKELILESSIINEYAVETCKRIMELSNVDSELMYSGDHDRTDEYWFMHMSIMSVVMYDVSRDMDGGLVIKE